MLQEICLFPAEASDFLDLPAILIMDAEILTGLGMNLRNPSHIAFGPAL